MEFLGSIPAVLRALRAPEAPELPRAAAYARRLVKVLDEELVLCNARPDIMASQMRRVLDGPDFKAADRFELCGAVHRVLQERAALLQVVAITTLAREK